MILPSGGWPDGFFIWGCQMALLRKEMLVRERFFPKLARVLASVPFAEDLFAAYYCAFDKATPLKAKGILIGALAYFILPFDAVPDFIAGLGRVLFGDLGDIADERLLIAVDIVQLSLVGFRPFLDNCLEEGWPVVLNMLPFHQ